MEDSHVLDATKKKPILGVAGVLIAFIALGIAVLVPLGIRAAESEKATSSSTSSKRILNKLVDKFKNEKQSATDPLWPQIVTFVATGMGFVGLVLGCVSWTRREDGRIAGVAITVSVGTLLWSYVLVAIIAVFLVLVLWLFITFWL